MNVWAIADLHLSFGVPSKSMEAFGEAWKNYSARIEENWKKLIHPEDLVLIPGDISWAIKWEEALVDLKWIASLPGTKVLLRGNHDYWWGSLKKMQASLPPTLHLIQNNGVTFHGITIGGSRLWDTPEYGFGNFIDYVPNPKENEKEKNIQEELAEDIFVRELNRLRLSLQTLDPKAHTRIAMTHYPPIGADLAPSRASAILEEFHIKYCVFGHLHNIKKGSKLFGEKNGIKYILTAADYLHFTPIKII
jgi:uncharacterized protein